MGYEERRARARIAEKKYRDNLSSEKKVAHNATRRKKYNGDQEKKAAHNAKRREGYVKRVDLSKAEREIKRQYHRQATRKYRTNLDPKKRASLRRKNEHTPERRAYRNQWAKNLWANNEDYRQKILAQNKAMRRWIRSSYGLTSSDYTDMLASQSGLCAICKRPDSGRKDSPNLHVDHCHKTGKVRGLLCAACNQGLGRFKDDPHLLRAAAKYLEFPR